MRIRPTDVFFILGLAGGYAFAILPDFGSTAVAIIAVAVIFVILKLVMRVRGKRTQKSRRNTRTYRPARYTR